MTFARIAPQVACCLPFLCLLVSVAGCGKTPERLYPVRGTVHVGDKPLDGGTVQFEMLEQGAASGKVYTSSAQIQPDGSYTLSTFGKPGAPVGEHRVWVSPNFAAMPDELGVNNVRRSAVPKKYMLPTTTDLVYTVKEEDNVIDIEVPAR